MINKEEKLKSLNRTIVEIIIAECPLCGCKRYSWDREDALNKLVEHRCSATLLDKELAEILDKIIEGGK